MSGRLKVTAALITRNEERVIGRCLKSLAWADEILVIDAESTDRTVEICKDCAQSRMDRFQGSTHVRDE